MKLRQICGVDGAFLSWNDLQAAVSQVNAQVQEETDREWSPGQGDDGPTRTAPSFSHKPVPSAHLHLPFPEILAVSLINEALDQDNPEKTLSSLLLPAASLDDISLPVAPRYHLLLMAAKRRKAQVRFGLAGLVTSTGRISPVRRAVPSMHPGKASLMDMVPSGGGRQGASDLALGKKGRGPVDSTEWPVGTLCVGRAQVWGAENPGCIPCSDAQWPCDLQQIPNVPELSLYTM